MDHSKDGGELAATYSHDNGSADEKRPVPDLKLDRRGLPLVPQPTNHRDDPLNWSQFTKTAVVLQIAFLALIGHMSAAAVNPAFVPLGQAFGLSTVEASYELTVYIIFGGIGPLFVVPLSNVYGRRPIYLGGNLIAAITNLIAGHCTSWSGLLATRVFNGIGVGSTVAIGAATICDLFFLHERGFWMGIYTLFLTNGPHFAPLIGGFMAQNLGWSYCFTVPSYIQFFFFVITLLFLPETLYSRKADVINPPNGYVEDSHLQRMTFRSHHLPKRSLSIADWIRPFMMLKYISIVLPAIYYMTSFTYGSVLFATSGSTIFKAFYNFNVAQTGLMLSIPLFIGCLIGEASAGWFTDWLVYRYAKKHDGQRPPEARLDALWAALLLPIGTIIQGVCITHYKTTGWIGNAFGMGISSLGLQVCTTVVYAYTTDCFKPQSAEISLVLNCARSVFSAFVSFYAVPLGTKIQYEYAWLVFALINVVLLISTGLLRVYGERIRAKKWQSPPTFHNDL